MSTELMWHCAVPNYGDHPTLRVALAKTKTKSKDYYTVLIHGMGFEYNPKDRNKPQVAQLNLDSFRFLFYSLNQITEIIKDS